MSLPAGCNVAEFDTGSLHENRRSRYENGQQVAGDFIRRRRRIPRRRSRINRSSLVPLSIPGRSVIYSQRVTRFSWQFRVAARIRRRRVALTTVRRFTLHVSAEIQHASVRVHLSVMRGRIRTACRRQRDTRLSRVSVSQAGQADECCVRPGDRECAPDGQ